MVDVADHPAEAILRHAAGLPSAVIAMATRGRGPLGRLLLGSVADKVVRGATARVLLRAPSPW